MCFVDFVADDDDEHRFHEVYRYSSQISFEVYKRCGRVLRDSLDCSIVDEKRALIVAVMEFDGLNAMKYETFAENTVCSWNIHDTDSY